MNKTSFKGRNSHQSLYNSHYTTQKPPNWFIFSHKTEFNAQLNLRWTDLHEQKMIRSWTCNLIPEPNHTSLLVGAVVPGQKCRKQSPKHFFMQTSSRVPMEIKTTMESKWKKVATISSFQILYFASSPSHLSILMKITLYDFYCYKTATANLCFLWAAWLLLELWFLLICCLIILYEVLQILVTLMHVYNHIYSKFHV